MTHHPTAEHISEEMHECIERCSDCHDVCQETLVHSLRRGGEYAAAGHVVALLDCAQTCDTCRDFMLRGSELHPRMCGVCADACARCAESCEQLADGDEHLRGCAEECRHCEESCRAMAG